MATAVNLTQAELDEWADALESGGYAQGKGMLRRGSENGPSQWCCLGVLCDLKARKGEGQWKDWGTVSWDYMHDSLQDETYAPAEFINLDTQHGLARMNDGEPLEGDPPKTFREIAQWIRENLVPAEFINLDTQHGLARMNDGEPLEGDPPKTFREIAQWIRENLVPAV